MLKTGLGGALIRRTLAQPFEPRHSRSLGPEDIPVSATAFGIIGGTAIQGSSPFAANLQALWVDEYSLRQFSSGIRFRAGVDTELPGSVLGHPRGKYHRQITRTAYDLLASYFSILMEQKNQG